MKDSTGSDWSLLAPLFVLLSVLKRIHGRYLDKTERRTVYAQSGSTRMATLCFESNVRCLLTFLIQRQHDKLCSCVSTIKIPMTIERITKQLSLFGKTLEVGQKINQ
jgi:hypothetical protein